MNMLHVVENFYSSHQVVALVLAVFVIAWLPGSHLPIWRGLQQRLPVLVAFVDLCLSPLAVILLFTIVRASLNPKLLAIRDIWLPGLFYLVLCLTISWYVAKGCYALVCQRYIGERSSHPQPVPGLLRSLIFGTCLIKKSIMSGKP